MPHKENTQVDERSEEAPEEQAALDADGRERPAFLRSFPDDPELKQLTLAFERGDFHYIRTNAERVIAAASQEEVANAAREVRRRIDPDPLVIKLLLSAASLFVFLVLWSYFG